MYTILVANTMEMDVQIFEIPHKQHSNFLFRLSVRWSFPLVVRQFTLLFRSVKGAAHGMSFEHMPVTVLRLCGSLCQPGPTPLPPKINVEFRSSGGAAKLHRAVARMAVQH